MHKISWKARYSMGIEALDEQRAAFILVLNELLAGTMNGLESEAIGKLLARLATVMAAHFSLEEEAMAESAFAGLAHHRSMHQAMLKQVGEFVARNDNADPNIPLALLNFLRGWFAIHMLGDDLLFAHWLKEQAAR